MPKYAFFKGQFVPIEQAKISIMAHVVNYGTGCFEGIRAYWNEEQEQLYVFQMAAHYARLHRSCRILFISLPYSVEELGSMTVELLRREGYRENCYIRPLAYKATEGIGVRLHGLEDAFAMFTVPLAKYLEEGEGIHVGLSSWRRVEDNATPARGKIIGSYVNAAFAKTEALLNGYDEAIVLCQDGHVSEGSAENLFIVREGKLITPPLTADILEGITRAMLIQVARQELGLEVIERPIDRTELYVADEAFFCGTGVEVVGITKIDHRPIGTGQLGPIFKQIRRLYFDIVYGRVEKYKAWCTPVYDK